ncbi:leucine-rich repeat domain-containing protein [Pseudomonas huaxiensis]|uniref:leucine-rich repeat domain-containing protein n=1 Tax=Pseudomonas huaxiensis TaxID=2213017 RepID=UPI000DA68722|nr:leucine-rich repeat domain-containing protein [Pseudomonas huaxiensis]
MPRPPSSVSNTYDFHQHVIKERLPGWVSQLNADQLDRLQYFSDVSQKPWVLNALPTLREEFEQTQHSLRASTFALAKAMQDLKPIPDFAAPLLEERLHSAFGVQRELGQLKLVRFSRDWNWMLTQAELNHQVEPLLQAALQNFPQDLEWQPESVAIDGEFSVGSHLGYPRYHYTALPFSAQQFASECHALDLGQRYQQHLDDLLGREQVRSLAIEARKQQFHLDLLIARLCYNLRDDCERIHSLLSESPPQPGQDWPRCHNLSLFGIDILDAVLIHPARDSVAVLLYLPGVEDGALTRYPTPGACQRALVRRLCQPAFRRRFMGFIQQDKAQHFASVLQRNLTGQTLASERETLWHADVDTDLHWNQGAIDDELFGYLQDRHHRRLLNEARQLAVPSADTDEAARKQRLQHWESLGLDLLGAAAFFIPAAGQLMTLVFVAQVLDTVYEGVQSWRQGDIDAALSSVKAVAMDGVMAVAGGVGFHYASSFTGKLLEVVRPDGGIRLWNADLTPYKVQAPRYDAGLDSLGKGVVDGRHSMSLEDAHYQITPHADGERWRIVHPDDPHAFQPILEHNGQGAWRLAHETPQNWSRATLLRRIGHRLDGYSDQELEIASRISGISRDDLLDIHLRKKPVPVRLFDTLQRLRGGKPAEHPLDAALDGLYLSQRRCISSDRLALWSLPRDSAWPADARLELRGGDISGPLLERAGERQAGDLRLIVKIADGYRAVLDGQPQAVTEDVFEALAQAMPEFNGDTEALKERIAENAQRDRESTQRWLWSGQDYGWADQGRLLGGFDRPGAYPPPNVTNDPLIARYRQLYPQASEASARAQLAQWHAAERYPHLEIRALERQLEYLRTTLGQWANGLPGRTQIRENLLANWQHLSNAPSTLDLAGLGLVDADFADFPHLSEAYTHINELNLGSNELNELPDLLIRQLPSLHSVWAVATHLKQFPEGLGRQLTEVDFTDNQIAWGPASQRALEQCPALQALKLAGNPLGSPPDISRLPNLRELGLFDTDLQHFPPGLGLAQQLENLELSANLITELPTPLDMSRAAQEALNLEYNPLNADALIQIETHFRVTGIDLMVPENHYSELLQNADAQTLECWQRVSRTLPLQYRRDLRLLAESATFRVSPACTRRRFWFMLRWLQTPLAQESATSIQAQNLLTFEMAADLNEAVVFPGMHPTARQQTEHLLGVAVAAIRYQTVSEALRLKFPVMTDLELETFRARTLQRIAADPRIPLRLAPMESEAVSTQFGGGRLQSLDAQWTTQLHERLLELNPGTVAGRNALWGERPNGDYVYAFWVDHLRQRYADDFTQLQEHAEALLQTAEAQMNEGDYLIEANRLHRQFNLDQVRLMDDLTRSIADGTQTRW